MHDSPTVVDNGKIRRDINGGTTCRLYIVRDSGAFLLLSTTQHNTCRPRFRRMANYRFTYPLCTSGDNHHFAIKP
jgi:hypothetical protein